MARHAHLALATLLVAALAPAEANGPLNYPFPRFNAETPRAPGGLMQHGFGALSDLNLRKNKFVGTMAKAKVAVGKVGMDFEKYPKLFAAGGFCAAITHFVTVPFDVVKTRLQVPPPPHPNPLLIAPRHSCAPVRPPAGWCARRGTHSPVFPALSGSFHTRKATSSPR